MKAMNQAMNPQGTNKPVKFSTAITAPSMQAMIMKSVPDARAAARLTGSLISVVNASEQLQACTPTSIISAALRGEGMGLILGHGYYVVPFGNVATFVLGYKGYIGLAMATGHYADIDCIDVREGELKGINRRTCKPDVDFSTYSSLEEREDKKVIGYYAYFELKDGTFRYEYWSIDKLLRHADHYSKAFKLEKYRQMVDGELAPADIERLRKGSPWYDVGGGQDIMFRKTVLRQLLNSGYAPLSNEVRSIIRNDDEEGVIAANIPVTLTNDEGEVIETTATVLEKEDASGSDLKAADGDKHNSRKSRETSKAARGAAEHAKDAPPAADEAEKDFTKGFFD